MRAEGQGCEKTLADHIAFLHAAAGFVDAFGRSAGREEVERKVRDYIARWKAEGLGIEKADLKHRVKADEARRVQSLA